MSTLRAKTSDRTAGRVAWSPSVSDAAEAVVILAALIAAYWSSFHYLFNQWWNDPNYSYGFFVAPIAAAVFWDRRGMLDRSKMRPKWWGFLPLIAVVAMRYPLYEWNEQYIETATIPIVVAGLALAVGGWHLLRVALPSIAFLAFMLPLPPSVNQLLARPLQGVATLGSVMLLQMMSLPVMAEGNVIYIGGARLEVARACNGLSMLLSFVTLIVATVLLVKRPIYERVILLLSAIPIALASNIIRITATALCYHWLGEKWGEKVAHDLAGWAMMPIALLLLYLELSIMSWMVVEVEEIDPALMLRKKGRHSPPAAAP